LRCRTRQNPQNHAFPWETGEEELAYEMNKGRNRGFCWEFVEYIGCMPNKFCGLRILFMRCLCIGTVFDRFPKVALCCPMRQSLVPQP
jgi:hypothetical protein